MSCSYLSKQTDLFTLFSSSVAPLSVTHPRSSSRCQSVSGPDRADRTNEPRDIAAATVEEVSVFTR